MNINYIYLDITNKCNMNCLYCCKASESCIKCDIDMSLLYRILNWAGLQGVKSITLSGGEPALHNDFGLILKKVKESYFESLRVMTNGFLFGLDLDIDVLDLIDEVCFSIDTSIEENNKAIRTGFDNNTIRNINTFREKYPDIRLTIKSTITTYNKKDIKSLINFSIKHGFSKITFGFCLPLGKAADINTYTKIRGEVSELLAIQEYIARMKRRYNLLIEIVEPCVVFGCKLTDDNERFDLHIDENCNIYPCDGMNSSEYIVANIASDNFEKNIFENLNKIKSAIQKNNAKCSTCSISEKCKGSCLLYGESRNKGDADMFCEFRRLKTAKNNLVRFLSDV